MGKQIGILNNRILLSNKKDWTQYMQQHEWISQHVYWVKELDIKEYIICACMYVNLQINVCT